MRTLTLALLIGCSGPSVTPPQNTPEPVEAATAPPPAAAAPAPEATKGVAIDGTVVSSGVAGGKTMEAWSGVPVRTPWVRITPTSLAAPPAGASDALLVQLPAGADPTVLTAGIAVSVSGVWRQPKALSAIEEEGIAQVPIEPGPDGEDRTVPRELVLVADQLMIGAP